MALPQFSMRELIDAGVHFGHKTKRWNPKMGSFLYGVRNDIHIIDLQQTVPLLHQALHVAREVVSKNGRVLFVGTKFQAMEPIAEAAKRCGQYYINQRWLGGMLTNWQTIQASIKKLRKMEELLGQEKTGLTKKETLDMQRAYQKLEKSLGGIKEMGGLPDLIFIIDTNKEDLAVKEAKVLGIPVIAILDSNSSPDHITYPVPGNDDATRAIRLYCRLISDAVLDGLQQSLSKSGVDLGASAEVPASLVQSSPKEANTSDESKDDGKKGGKSKKAAPVVVKKAVGKLKEADSEEEESTEEASEESSEEKSAKKAAAPKAKKEGSAKKPASKGKKAE
jgi:small subunit ribosomal protein S2